MAYIWSSSKQAWIKKLKEAQKMKYPIKYSFPEKKPVPQKLRLVKCPAI